MILSTRRVFVRLLSRMEITGICDVGSMDGADALIFRAAAPQSTIYAFEPNPANLAVMQASQALAGHNITVVPMAASNCDGEAEFYVVDADYSRLDARRGMSSLYKREETQWTSTAKVLRVRTTRLDTFLAGKCSPSSRLALSIDVEGKSYEALEGLAGVRERVHLLHVEVETTPCIGSNQRLYPEVKALLQQFGFREVATDQSPREPQFNALFVRNDLSGFIRLHVWGRLTRGRLRHLATWLVRKVCPACSARLRALRRRP